MRALEELRTPWTRLWEQCPGATPFQTPEWLLPALQVLGGRQLVALAFFSSEFQLIGLIPLLRHRSGCIPTVLVYRFLGSGVSDYLTGLAAPEFQPAVRDGLLTWLADQPASVLDLQQLPPASMLRRDDGGTMLPSWHGPHDPCPVLALPGSVAELPGVLPAHLRKNLRYYRRRVEALGEVALETADGDTWPEFLEALFRLHTARWRTRGQPGVFCLKRRRAFHRAAVPQLIERGLLRLHGLRVDGVLRGALYALVGHGRAFYYASGFDPALQRYSPGTLLVAHAMEDAIRLGLREFDFLRGQERYKARWGATPRWNERRIIWNRGAGSEPAARVIVAAAQIENRLKAWCVR